MGTEQAQDTCHCVWLLSQLHVPLPLSKDTGPPGMEPVLLGLQFLTPAPKRRSWHEVVNWGNILVCYLNGFVSIFCSGIQKLLLHFNSNPNLYPPQASCSVNCWASLATSQLSQPGDTTEGLKCIPSIVRVGEGQLRLVASIDCAISPPLPLHHKLRPENKSHPFFLWNIY